MLKGGGYCVAVPFAVCSDGALQLGAWHRRAGDCVHLANRPAGILEAVNALLSGGDVPGLWPPGELAKELGPLEALRDSDAAWRGGGSLHAYFLHRVQVSEGAARLGPHRCTCLVCGSLLCVGASCVAPEGQG